MEVLRHGGLHPGAEAAGHHDGCEGGVGHGLRSLELGVPQGRCAGAPGFEPGIAGPKPAALPLGYAPRACGRSVYGRRLKSKISATIASSATRPIASALTTAKRDRDAEHEQLRRGEDPARLAQGVRAVRAAAYHQKSSAIAARATASHQCRTPNDVEQALDRRDPERDPQAPFAQPATRARRAMFDRVRAVHSIQPYHAGTVIQSRPRRRNARSAASASARRWKSA